MTKRTLEENDNTVYNSVEAVDTNILRHAQAIAAGECKTPNDEADHAQTVVYGRTRGILPEELPEWPIHYVSPRVDFVADSLAAQT